MNDTPRLYLPRVHCFIDFDGTISAEDTTDLLLGQFAAPEWRAVEAAWERGEIGSRECMCRQVELLSVEPALLDLFVGCVGIDSGFAPFVEALRASGAGITIVSDGLDRVIARVLERHAIDLPVTANRLVSIGGNRWRLDCPHAAPDCRAGAAHCKCDSLDNSPPGELRVLIGDGRSDFCAASAADMVFAKGNLVRHCRENGISHRAFDSFADLAALFTDWLADVSALQPIRFT